MTALLARDAPGDRVLHVDGEERVLDVHSAEGREPTHFAVFEDGAFLGLVGVGEAALHSRMRIFADLLPERSPEPVRDDTPLSELRHLDWQERDAVPVVDEAGAFVGALTRGSLLRTLLDEQICRRICQPSTATRRSSSRWWATCC